MLVLHGGNELAHDTTALGTTALLEAAAHGDQSSWNALVDRFNGLLWGVARGYRLGDADTADAVQTTWLRLVENLGRIDDPERLPGWLATTVRRECLRLLRKRAPERLGAEWEAADATAIDADLLVAERDAALWRALATLSEQCQRLLRVLMASPPPSYAAVSDALDMPIGSIGPSRQRCLDRLRRVATGDELLRKGDSS